MTQNTRVLRSQKPLSNTVVLVCVAFLVVFGVLAKLGYDGKQYNGSLAAEVAALKKRVLSKEDDVSRLDHLLKKYPEDIARFEKVLFKDKDIPLFLEGISALSRQFETEVRSITQASSAKLLPAGADKGEAQPLQAVSFQITLNGQMENILRFLQEIEKSPQLLTISEMTMSVKEHPLVTCTFSLDLYSLNMLPGRKAVAP